MNAIETHMNTCSSEHVRVSRVIASAMLHVVATMALYVTGTSLAHAIPSPDLVINLSASVAQLLGLLSVVFGGFAMNGRDKLKRANKGKGWPGSSRGTRWLLAFAGIFLLGSVAINVLQYTSTLDQRNARLHTNLIRKSIENGETVGDTSLKTLSFSEQLDHQQGISTEQLAEWLDNGEQVNIIDVRENEEFEVGSIDGAAHLRYPDVLSRSSVLPDQGEGRTLLLCYSGNRSSELCGELAAQGKACNFMVGGYEKWLSEKRALSTDVEIDADELRKLPDFQNKDVLLDTPDVVKLVTEQQAEFIDVRYPEDFVADHLPGAHNITMRALHSAALAEKIKALPDTPLIAPCYDKRSCFYGQLIGLRIERAGKDFRGRYTVPHEYYVPAGTGERAHVAALKAEQQLTLASYVVTPLRKVLDTLEQYTGHYAFALLGIVMVLRLILLPLALKADRDTRVQKSLAGRVAALREEFANHPRALGEATLALYRRYRIRPVVNTLASVFQLGFLLLFYSAVNQSAPFWSGELAWMPNAAAPDPLLVLPVVASALFVALIALQVAPATFRGRALLVLGGAALLWLLQGLGAAVNLYLAISMAFLVLQTMAFNAIGKHLDWDTLGSESTRPVDDAGLVPLAAAHRLPEATGKKAARLAKLIDAGYRVPPGFVVTAAITKRLHDAPDGDFLTAGESRQLDQLWKTIGGGPVAVRSSGTNEDGADASFAGVYESILNVTRERLENAVRAVHASLDSSRSASYSKRSGQAEEAGRGGVVVQKMVAAEFAGVMFTEHPGTSGAMLVELVSGLGEELVSGTVTPDAFAFGKLTGERVGDDTAGTGVPPIDLEPLLAQGRELEALFGQPQDIEWAYAQGEFHLLQTRDITRSVTVGSTPRHVAERERARLIRQLLGDRRLSRRTEIEDAEAPVFVQNELSELLPRPTPLSADFMGRLWAAGGSTDIACNELGIPYDVHYRSVPYIVTVFGWTYVNKQEEMRRLGKGPSAMATFRLSRDAEEMERAFREDFLPRFRNDMTERNAIAMDRLGLDTAIDLFSRWTDRFVTETYVEAERINIAAEFHTKSALAKLTAAKLDPGKYLADSGETVVTRAMSQLAGPAVRRANVEAFLTLFGHRAPLDYELATPRFAEDMDLVRQYIKRNDGRAHALPGTGQDATARADTDPEGLDDDGAELDDLPSDRVLRIAVRRARDFTRLKEEAKHYCLLELAQLRALLLVIDRKSDLDGHIFQLHIDEVLALGDPARRAELERTTLSRLADAKLYQSLQLSTTLSVADLERADMLTGERPGSREQSALGGKRVAGERPVTGMVRVITDVADIETFQNGEILVARMTDPTWYPLFARASGIVTEIGGWLSHAAIVAREYDLPAIVGVQGVSRTLSTGELVTLNLDGTIDRLDERRADEPALIGRLHARAPARPTLGSVGQAKAETVHVSAIEQEHSHEQIVLPHRRFQRAAERRAIKAQLDARLDIPRDDAGERQPADRRATSRAENALSTYHKAA